MQLLFRLLSTARKVYLRLTRRVSIGVKVLCINSQNEVLLVEHSYDYGWHFPGGGLSWGESTREAAVRELREETGLLVQSDRLILVGVYSQLNAWFSDHIVLYAVKELVGEPRAASYEIKHAAWFPVDRVPPDTSASTKKSLEEFLQDEPRRELW